MGVFVIAEAGLLHDGSLGNAIRMTEVAATAGADAIKFQLHDPQAEMIRDAPSPSHFATETRWDYYQRTSFSDAQWARLKDACDGAGIEFLCSAFSVEALERLEQIGVHRHKIPSGEVTNLELVGRVAATGRPVLISSGMSSILELDAAVEVAGQGGGGVTVLQCTSAYPCPPERAGLNVLAELRERYRHPVGFSDHTFGIAVALAAAALGAEVVEKHFTLSREMYGADARFAADPDELRRLVEGIRAIEQALASPIDKDDIRLFEDAKLVYEKSVVTLAAIAAGSVIGADAVAVKKPGNGIAASRLPEVVGRRALRDLAADQVVLPGDVDWEA